MLRRAVPRLTSTKLSLFSKRFISTDSICSEAKLKELTKLQTETGKLFARKYPSVFVRPFNHVGYIVTNKRPEAIIEQGGFIGEACPGFSIPAVRFWLMPEVAAAHAYFDPIKSPYTFIYAVRMSGNLVVKNHKVHQFLAPGAFPLQGPWYAKECLKLDATNINLGNTLSYGSLKTSVQKDRLTAFLKNDLKMPTIVYEGDGNTLGIEFTPTDFSKQLDGEIEEHYSSSPSLSLRR